VSDVLERIAVTVISRTLLEPEQGSFLNGFSRLPEKLAPPLVLDLALFAPRRKVGAYASFKKLASVF
jgi:hypothetical protein